MLNNWKPIRNCETVLLATALILAIICSPISAQTIWSDDFESYEAGSELTGQGGWSNWFSNVGTTGMVSDKYAFSGRNSLEVGLTTDTVQQWDLRGGRYILTVRQYIPSGSSGTSIFALCSRYGAGSQEMNLLTRYQLSSGTITSDRAGLTSIQIIYDEWVEIKVIIDLDTRIVEEYYDAELIFRGIWSANNTWQNVDIWSDGASPIYYDDFRLTWYVEPNPADGAVDVACATRLSWWSYDAPPRYDVYFGTSYEDVQAATVMDPLGVLVGIGQQEPRFDPGRLEFGQTYYWRVDSVDAALGDVTPTGGRVWRFTTEPYVYPITNIIATSNGISDEASGPQRTVDGSGLDDEDQHSLVAAEMWLADPPQDEALYIQYEFDRVYKLQEMLVWNYNHTLEMVLGFGLKEVTVEYSADGDKWMTLGDFDLNQATARSTYVYNSVIDFSGVAAKYVRILVHSGWGTLSSQYGLSEVRFYHLPVLARAPVPADGATGTAIDANLTWRPGREAATHQVFIGTDEATLPLVDTVNMAAYTPPLDFNQTYFWKVAEVNEAETPSFWDSDTWSFTTGSFLTIDDFEAYDNDLDAGTTIYQTWIDGLTDGSSGSQVGYEVAPFAERRTVRGGRQSMPLQYDNSVSPFFSQAERTFDSPQDWTIKGADTLSLYFRGIWTNAPAFMEMASGSIVMNGIGSDIWFDSDAFRYAYKALDGDGTMIARVESIHSSNVWAKAGVMIRESLEPGSRFAFICATPAMGVRFQARSAPNVDATTDTSVATPEQVALQTPVWVRIERVGDTFNGFYSTDGQAWTEMSWNPRTINMASSVCIGLALCSHEAAAATSAEFSNISMTGDVTGDWQVAEIGAKQPEGNPVEGVYVTVTDSAGNTNTVVHPDAGATGHVSWQHWKIPMNEFISAGVQMDAVKSMAIGVGNRIAPVQGGTGTIYIDDISFGKPAIAE